MARISKKQKVLDEAYKLIDSEGFEAVTYDRLSAVTGMSKSGLIYHFPSRHAMLVAIHTMAAERWESEIIDTLPEGADLDSLTDKQRRRAAVKSMTKTGPLAEMSLQIHARTHPDFSAPWRAVEGRWMVDPSADASLEELMLTIVASGLWSHDHIFQRTLSDSNRAKIIEAILAQKSQG